MQGHEHHAVAESFPTDTRGLPEATRPQVAALRNGDEFALAIVPVAKRIGDATVRMLAYNQSIPGPTIKLPQGSTATVHVTNHGDLEATVHWHGLRLENRFDGTHDTQAPIPVGETFSYEITVPDQAPIGTTLTSARTTARNWGCTATSSSRPPSRTIGRPRTASCSLPWTTS